MVEVYHMGDFREFQKLKPNFSGTQDGDPGIVTSSGGKCCNICICICICVMIYLILNIVFETANWVNYGYVGCMCHITNMGIFYEEYQNCTQL